MRFYHIGALKTGGRRDDWHSSCRSRLSRLFCRVWLQNDITTTGQWRLFTSHFCPHVFTMHASHHLFLFVSTGEETRILRVDMVKTGLKINSSHSGSRFVFDSRTRRKSQRKNEAAAAAKHKCGLMWSLILCAKHGTKGNIQKKSQICQEAKEKQWLKWQTKTLAREKLEKHEGKTEMIRLKESNKGEWPEKSSVPLSAMLTR